MCGDLLCCSAARPHMLLCLNGKTPIPKACIKAEQLANHSLPVLYLLSVAYPLFFCPPCAFAGLSFFRLSSRSNPETLMRTCRSWWRQHWLSPRTCDTLACDTGDTPCVWTETQLHNHVAWVHGCCTVECCTLMLLAVVCSWP